MRVFGVRVNTLLPEAETWVDLSVGRQAPGWVPQGEGGREREMERGRETERSRAARSAGSSVCVSQALWLSTGAAWHPQECGFSRLPKPPPVPQGGGRQEKGGKGGRNPRKSLKQRPIYLIFYRRAQEAERAPRNRPGSAGTSRASWAL